MFDFSIHLSSCAIGGVSSFVLSVLVQLLKHRRAEAEQRREEKAERFNIGYDKGHLDASRTYLSARSQQTKEDSKERS